MVLTNDNNDNNNNDRRNRATKSKKVRMFIEKETYKYLGILEADIIKQVQMKDKIAKDYPRWMKKLLETKL